MSNNKIYWRGTEELTKDPEFVKSSEKEFAEELPIEQFLGKNDLRRYQYESERLF